MSLPNNAKRPCITVVAPPGRSGEMLIVAVRSSVGTRTKVEEVSGRGLSIVCQHTSTYVSIRPHMSSYGGVEPRVVDCLPAYVRIRAHTSACVLILRRCRAAGCRLSASIRLHTSAFVSILQHISACVSMHTPAHVSIRQHASAYASIRPHTSAYVRMRQHTRLVDKSGRQPRVSVPLY